MTRDPAQRRSDGDRTRLRLLEAALPLFAAKGYAGTSVRQIAAAADANVAAIAYHFGDKKSLYDQVVVRLHDDMERDFPSDLLQSTDPHTLLAMIVARAWGFVKDHRDHIRLQVRHVLDTGGQPEVVVQQRSEPLLQRAELLIGLFRPGWSQVQRRLLVLSLMHAIVRLSLEDPRQLAHMLGGCDDLDRAICDFFVAQVRRELGLGDTT
jgi:AcrR family transcriptional regulator